MRPDRDQSIERLLRRRGRTAAPPGPDCLDAEALAMLVDDMLSAVERDRLDTHLADCDRCRAMAAALVRSAPPPQGEAASAPSWWSRRGALNWLIPATAAVAAVALWVYIPGQRQAFREPAGATDKAVAVPEQAAQADQALVQPAPPAPQLPGPASTSAQAADRSDPLQAPAESLGDRAPFKAEEERDEDRARSLQPSPADTLREAAEAASAPAPAAPAAPSARQQGGAAATSAARAASAAFSAFVEVTSTDPRVRWRISRGPVIERSVDSGATWSVQATGLTGSVSAGSSPSPLVCWLVGGEGVVLRTSDGGASWQRGVLPQQAGAVAVNAQDDMTATVSLADGRRLATKDGGQTWSPLSE